MTLSGEFLRQGGAVAVLIVFVVAILTGRLRPNRAVQEVRIDRDERLADAREQIALWRDAYQISEHNRERQEVLIRDILEISRASAAILEAIREVATTRE